MILDLYNNWKKLEIDSKREDRSSKEFFKKKTESFVDSLETPVDISKKDAKEKMMKSGIIDWAEDWEHLQNQLKKEQVGTIGGQDKVQLKREHKKADRELQKIKAEEKEERRKDETKILLDNSQVNDEDREDDSEDEDQSDTFIGPSKSKQKKVDVMGAVSNTGD